MKAINRQPVAQDVASQIRAAILDGGLLPGSKIAQDELAALLGVSRLPVRQALLVLQREGLVALDHGRGAVVAPLDIKFISDLFDVRAAVEGYVAGALAARATFDLSRLRQIVQAGREAANRGESRRDLVKEFHTVLYESLGNSVLVSLMNPLLDHVQRVVTIVQTSRGQNRSIKRTADETHQPGLRSQVETWNEHAEIVEAIARRRIGRARALARAHVDRVKHVVVAYLVASAKKSSKASTLPRGARHTKMRELGVTLDSLGLR
jgi:DNA-binding GntR family transcriptional regulator